MSIIIASFSSVTHLTKCLKSLYPLPLDTEIIISTIFSSAEVRVLQQFNAKFIHNNEERHLDSIILQETLVFRLRTKGIQAAEGKVIALIEDHCEAVPNWANAMQAAINNQYCIAGGPVMNNAKSGIYRWALYWSEYAAMMPPLPTKDLYYLSAVNSAYHKEALERCKSIWHKGFYDNEVHDALIKSGAVYCPIQEASVSTNLPFTFKRALVHLYTGGRRYGNYRGGSDWTIKRAFRLLTTFLVPTVLLFRVFKLVRRRQPNLTFTLLKSTPILYLLLFSWAVGEFLGTLLNTNDNN
tara:strand:- start:1202 stop:2092 length:891 start_codon:yes stop_codon:yes gene_type:complete